MQLMPCSEWWQPEGIVLTSQCFADTSRGVPHSPGFLGCPEGKTGTSICLALGLLKGWGENICLL